MPPVVCLCPLKKPVWKGGGASRRDIRTKTGTKMMARVQFKHTEPGGWMTGFSNVGRTLGGDRSRDIHQRFDGSTPRTLTCHQICGQWSSLDRLLVRFWESRSIRPRVTYDTSMVQWGWARAYTKSLLPQITARGIIDYVEPEV